MESHITTIEQLKNLNIKCLNALEQLNNKLIILNGSNIVLPKEKSFIITL